MPWTISKPLTLQVRCPGCMSNVGFNEREALPSMEGRAWSIVCPECKGIIIVATGTHGKKIFRNNVTISDQGV